MKFTIEGFSQQRAVELGLSVEDLVILRWFVDFWPSEKMTKMQHNGKMYALVNYSGFIEQMPIIGCNKRTIARKFQRLVEADVLENTTIKQGGTFSVYRFGSNYDSLVQKSVTVVQDCTGGLYKNEQPGMYENVQPNTNLFNSTNLINTHIPPNPQREEKPKKQMLATEYCQDVLDKFATICKELPKPQKLTDNRKRAISKAMPDITSFGGWDKFFQTIANSDFLSGRNSEWRADFDWVLKPSNRIKIIEGKYTNRNIQPVQGHTIGKSMIPEHLRGKI